MICNRVKSISLQKVNPKLLRPTVFATSELVFIFHPICVASSESQPVIYKDYRIPFFIGQSESCIFSEPVFRKMFASCANSIPCQFPPRGLDYVRDSGICSIHIRRSSCKISGFAVLATKERSFQDKLVKNDKFSRKPNNEALTRSNAIQKKSVKKVGKNEHHLWKRKDSAGSGQKALNLIRTIADLPNEKEAVYGALNKWAVWETEFPLIAASKALAILRKRSQWTRVIQVAKWMLSKGQGTTMGTYDTLLMAFDMDNRVDEAESLWNMILHTHTRSISKKLFSRMIALYDHHDMNDKIIDVFADMEELSISPDEDTVWRIARAFHEVGQDEKRKLLLEKYLSKWKFIHFNGERVTVKRNTPYKGSSKTN